MTNKLKRGPVPPPVITESEQVKINELVDTMDKLINQVSPRHLNESQYPEWEAYQSTRLQNTIYQLVDMGDAGILAVLDCAMTSSKHNVRIRMNLAKRYPGAKLPQQSVALGFARALAIGNYEQAMMAVRLLAQIRDKEALPALQDFLEVVIDDEDIRAVKWTIDHIHKHS